MTGGRADLCAVPPWQSTPVEGDAMEDEEAWRACICQDCGRVFRRPQHSWTTCAGPYQTEGLLPRFPGARLSITRSFETPSD